MKEAAAKTAGFDISSLDVVKAANDGANVELVHPVSGEGLGIRVRVIGKDSDEFRRLIAAQSRRRVQRMAKQGRGVKAPDQEEIEHENVDLLAASTLGWEGMVYEGKELPFTRENAVMVYSKYPWVREQVDVAIGDRSLFIKA